MSARLSRVFVAAACLLPIAAAQDAKVQSGGGASERQAASMFFYSQTKNSFEFHGQMELTYGAPAWKDEYADALETARPGQRFRIGSNFWATLDVNVAFVAGGKTFEAGMYYLALEVTAPNEAALVFLDAAEMRRKKIYSSLTEDTKEGVLAKLEWKENEELAKRLKLALVAEDQAHPENVVLVMRFGHQEFRLPMTAKLEAKTSK